MRGDKYRVSFKSFKVWIINLLKKLRKFLFKNMIGISKNIHNILYVEISHEDAHFFMALLEIPHYHMWPSYTQEFNGYWKLSLQTRSTIVCPMSHMNSVNLKRLSLLDFSHRMITPILNWFRKIYFTSNESCILVFYWRVQITTPQINMTILASALSMPLQLSHSVLNNQPTRRIKWLSIFNSNMTF